MRGKTFRSPLDANDQLSPGCRRPTSPYSRPPRSPPSSSTGTGTLCGPLSPVASVSVFRSVVRLPRYYYVQLFSNYFSVDQSATGRILVIEADLDRVTVNSDGRPTTAGSSDPPNPTTAEDCRSDCPNCTATKLLIVGEVGIDQDTASLFFQLVSSRYDHLPGPHQQPCLQPVGRGLQRRESGFSHDRPDRPQRGGPEPHQKQLRAGETD